MCLVEPISNFEANAGTFEGGRNLGAKGRAGRPAEAGDRHGCGKLKPHKDRNAGSPPAQIKRLFDAALRGAADPLYGTSLGLLYAGREITAQELAAGTAYAKLRGRFDRVMGIPGRFTLSPDDGTGRASSSREPLTEREVAQVKKRHGEMMGVIHASMSQAIDKQDERAKLKGDGVRLVTPRGPTGPDPDDGRAHCGAARPGLRRRSGLRELRDRAVEGSPAAIRALLRDQPLG